MLPVRSSVTILCARLDSNQEPSRYKLDALPLSYARIAQPRSILAAGNKLNALNR